MLDLFCATNCTRCKRSFNVCAICVTLWLAYQNNRRADKLSLRAQAANVTAWFVEYDSEQDHPHRVYYGLCVNNGSQEPVYDLVAKTVRTSLKTPSSDTHEKNVEFTAKVGCVPPGRINTRINTPGGGMHKRYSVEIAFRDAAGQHWIRQGNGILKELSVDPISFYNLTQPVSWEH